MHQSRLQHLTHEHITLTSIERQVILFGNLSFPNRVCLVSHPNAAVIKFRRDTYQRRHSDLEGSVKGKKTS